MTAVIFVIVINSTFSERRFVTITMNTRIVIESNLPASVGQVEISFNTVVKTELSFNKRCEKLISGRNLYHIITNSSPTESFNIDNKSKFDRRIIRISNIKLWKGTGRIFRKKTYIFSAHNTNILCMYVSTKQVISKETRAKSEVCFSTIASRIEKDSNNKFI